MERNSSRNIEMNFWSDSRTECPKPGTHPGQKLVGFPGFEASQNLNLLKASSFPGITRCRRCRKVVKVNKYGLNSSRQLCLTNSLSSNGMIPSKNSQGIPQKSISSRITPVPRLQFLQEFQQTFSGDSLRNSLRVSLGIPLEIVPAMFV